MSFGSLDLSHVVHNLLLSEWAGPYARRLPRSLDNPPSSKWAASSELFRTVVMDRRHSQSVQKSQESQSVSLNDSDGLDRLLTTLATSDKWSIETLIEDVDTCAQFWQMGKADWWEGFLANKFYQKRCTACHQNETASRKPLSISTKYWHARSQIFLQQRRVIA